MIRENQRLLNRLNVLSDALLLLPMLPLAFWLRFYVLPGGSISVPLERYLRLSVVYTLLQLVTFAAFGLYQSFRKTPLRQELARLFRASVLDMLALLGWLFIVHGGHYSRWTLAIAFVLDLGVLSAKRFVLRRVLRTARQRGYNQKYVLLLGGGRAAQRYLREIQRDRELGYQVIGYLAPRQTNLQGVPYLGGFEALEHALERRRPDEVVSAIEAEDFPRTPDFIAACEKSGTRLSIIPFYAEYMPSHPQFDDLNGIPLLNIRRIPLDNWGKALCKRAMDVVGSALLLILTSPILLACAIAVRLSSPGPIIFRQKRIGRGKKPFYMYKFRSMRVNDREETGWSSQQDARKTKVGAFLRKCSLDELPQLWNVLKGDMSLVGPRPEVPYYVEQFKEDVPLYMVKHQVRPGITGWAQVNGLRGDTSIRERVEHDIYYIENWTLRFDLRILLQTVFGGKFLNEEKLS